MAEFIIKPQTSEDDTLALVSAICDLIDEEKTVKVKLTIPSNGTLKLDAQWRALMPQVAKIMQSYGVTMKMASPSGKAQFERAFDADDAHDLFSSHFMPIGENGKRKSWSKAGRDGMEVATTGERCHALEKLYQYWLEKGHNLQRFNGSEYERLQEKQNA